MKCGGAAYVGQLCAFQVAQESDRRKLDEIRQVKERMEVEVKQVKKMAKTEIFKLVRIQYI